MHQKSRIVVLIIVAIACGPCSDHSQAGPFKRWKAARQASHAPSALPTCGPGGCPPGAGGGVSIAPGFQPLTPLAGAPAPQRMVQVQAAPGNVSVDVGAPMANVVAAPAPPRVLVSSGPAAKLATTTDLPSCLDGVDVEKLQALMAAIAASPPAPSAPARQPAPPVDDARLDALEAVTRAIAKKLDVPIETPSQSGMRELVDTLPTATLTIDHPDGTQKKAVINFASYLRSELGAIEPLSD